eukprot:c16111_g1_i1 orf=187-693(+)
MAMAAAKISATRVYADALSASASVSVRELSRASSSCSFAAGRPRRRLRHVVCQSESGGSCCGGSGNSSSGGGSGGCSSHGKNSLSNLGKEFEHMVAANTLLEFEKNYISAPMQGKITRDIINTVMDTYPEESATEGQKFLDINEIVEEARSVSNGKLVFTEDPDFVLV